jgi:glutaredoxin
MKIELLYILDCPWCVKTKELIRKSLEEIGAKANIREILIDSDGKARKYNFVGSPTIRIDGKDIQEEVSRGRCLPCEELAENAEGTTEFVKRECGCGCRVYFYKGKQYPYPPKEMIKEVIKKLFE